MNEFFFDIEDSFDSSSLMEKSKPRERKSPKSLDQIFDVQPAMRMKSGKSIRYSPKSIDVKCEAPESPYKLPWTTRFAKIVIGFKNGENIGRVGVGLIQNYQDKYRLIVYKTKSNVIATFTVQESVDVPQIHRQNCYWQFYDDIGVYWSLFFERKAEEIDFINKLNECGINIQLENNSIQAEYARPVAKLNRLESLNENNEKSENIDANALVASTPLVASTLGISSQHAISSQYADNRETLTVTNDHDENDKNTSNIAIIRTKDSRTRAKKIPWKTESQAHNNDNNVNSDADGDDDDDDDEEGDDKRGISQLRSSLTLIDHNVYATNSDMRKQCLIPLTHLSTVDGPKNPTVLKSVDGQVVQLMLVENRTQNTELRMNMDKIDSKIDKVLDKINTLHESGEQDDEICRLEEQILELKKENRRLKQDLKQISSKSEIRLNGNIGCLYGTELATLGIDVPQHGIPNVELIVGELIDKVQSLKTDLDDKETELKFRNLQNQEKKHLNVALSNELRQVQQKIELLEFEMDKGKQNESQFVSRLNEFKSEHVTLLNGIKLEMTQTLKDIMNTLYHNLAQNILDMENLVPDKILALIGKTIRHDTLRAVEKIKNK